MCLALKHLVFALKSPCCFSLNRFFHRLRADSTPSALRCGRLHPECKANAPRLRQDSLESCEAPDEYATCVYLSAVAKITADSGKCEATSRRNANLMGFLSRLVILSPICVCVTGALEPKKNPFSSPVCYLAFSSLVTSFNYHRFYSCPLLPLGC